MSRSAGPRVVTVNEVLDGHAVLDIQCLDRLYLSGLCRGCRRPAAVVFFLHQIRGMPIAVAIAVRTDRHRLPRPCAASLIANTSRWSASAAGTARSR